MAPDPGETACSPYLQGLQTHPPPPPKRAAEPQIISVFSNAGRVPELRPHCKMLAGDCARASNLGVSTRLPQGEALQLSFVPVFFAPGQDLPLFCTLVSPSVKRQCRTGLQGLCVLTCYLSECFSGEESVLTFSISCLGTHQASSSQILGSKACPPGKNCCDLRFQISWIISVMILYIWASIAF